MPLRTGARVGPHQVTSPLGAGGMGEVWRATDTRLGRDVALKVLTQLSAGDPERLARFQREARLLAALNHPNIAAIYGFEEAEGAGALVMELVEGPTLADRIARGALSIDDAFPIARQIADALEYAHEHGIVHRDLKPANVKVRDDGTVKVLDFGLAKAISGEAPGEPRSDMTMSPTITAGSTQAGMILGSAAYMSPEQAKGKAVDRRADIWAFGVVLYEMLAGERPFRGENVAETLASVMKDQPDWGRLPAGVPRRLRDLLVRCLTKDPKQRLRDIGEARIVLDAAVSGAPEAAPTSAAAGAGVMAGVGGADPPAATPAPDRVAWPTAHGTTAGGRARRNEVAAATPNWLKAVVAGIAGIVALVLIERLTSRDTADRSSPDLARHVAVVLPDQDVADAGIENLLLALSPDGRSLVYCARRDGTLHLFLRRLDQREPVLLEGTEGAKNPFFSPDGAWIGFFTAGKLRKVSTHGGGALDITATGEDRSGTWLEDGTIVYSPTYGAPLMKVPASGGEPQALTALDEGRRERTHRWPDAVAGGAWVIFTVGTADSPGVYEDAEIQAVSTKTGERRSLLKGASMARYAHPGTLLHARGGTLFASPLDVDTMKVTGPPVPVVSDVAGESTSGAVHVSVSREGTLGYLHAGPKSEESELVWVERSGRIEVIAAPKGLYSQPRISPDGRQVLVSMGPGLGTATWMFDFPRGTLNRLTFELESMGGTWLPDGRRYVAPAYDPSTLKSRLLVRDVDAASPPRAVYESDVPFIIGGVTSDGRWTLLSSYGATDADVFVVPIDGGEIRTVADGPDVQRHAVVSPDGRWLAYTSSEAGTDQIFVKRFGAPGGKWQVSVEGGFTPAWSRDGAELFYCTSVALMRVGVTKRGETIETGAPEALFDLPLALRGDRDFRNYDVAPDGRRFLFSRVARSEMARRQIDLVLNWTAGFGRGANR